MRFLEPEIITPVKLMMKNNITGEIQVSWFQTVNEANAAMSNVEGSGVLGTDYWIQNTPRGAENVVKFKDETIIPGAVHLQDTLHPTASSSTVRFYVCDNENGGVNSIRIKLIRIDYLCELYGMTKVAVYSINPQNDMIQKADMTAYLPGNLANIEDKLIKHYVSIYIMSAAGPMVDLTNDETHVEEEHVHTEECNHEHKEEGNGFRITTKQEEEKKETTKEDKKIAEEDDDNDPFAYNEDELESDQTVQLPEERY